MKTLDEIAVECQTDRASVFTRTYGKPHDYARHYDHVFSERRFDELKLLEIGVGGGEGIRMWLEYFSNCKVWGIDNVSETNLWNSPNHDTRRYTFTPGDQGSVDFWKQWIPTVGVFWDIVIDDGSHMAKDVITTFNALWPAVAPGGFYAIEDLGVCYGSGSVFVQPGKESQMDMLRGLLDILNTVQESDGTDIDSIYFACELAIIKKKE